MPLRLCEPRQRGREQQCEGEDQDDGITGRADRTVDGRSVKEPDRYHQQHEDEDRDEERSA